MELLPNGRNISLNNENKLKFIELYVEFQLKKSVQKQLDNFVQGFHTVVDSECLKMFEDAEEFQLMLSGTPLINLDDWIDNTVYNKPLSAHHEVVQWLWAILASLSQDHLRVFL